MVCPALLVDDHPVVRCGLLRLLGSLGIVDAIEAGSVAEARRAIHPGLRLVVIDDGLPDGRGLDLLPAIRAHAPDARVVAFVEVVVGAMARRAKDAGVAAYLTKGGPVTAVVEALREVLAVKGAPVAARSSTAIATSRREGGRTLTGRELAVLRLMSHGSTNPEIARMLSISRGTVRTHVSHILDKLWVADRTEAVAHALRAGLV